MCACLYACSLCRYQGYIGAALVLGGVDCNGPHLYSIYPHGSTDKLPYVTMGMAHTHTHTHRPHTHTHIVQVVQP